MTILFISFVMMEKNRVVLSDNELWERFLSGEMEAFELIYLNCVTDLFLYGSRFSMDEGLVRDSIQDLFIYLYNYRSKLSKTDKIMPYLMVSLKRTILKKMQIEKHSNHLNIDVLPFDYVLPDDDNEDGEENSIDALQMALNGLPPRQREAIYLKYVAGLSYDELSIVLEMGYQATRNLINRGMQSLRKSLNGNSIFSMQYSRRLLSQKVF